MISGRMLLLERFAYAAQGAGELLAGRPAVACPAVLSREPDLDMPRAQP
ncbi:hypothetical protein [Streptomyces sp. NPDC058371]